MSDVIFVRKYVLKASWQVKKEFQTFNLNVNKDLLELNINRDS